MFTAIVVITHVINLRQCDILSTAKGVNDKDVHEKKDWNVITNRQIRINYNNQEKSLDVIPAYKTVI